jgi:proline iminopeptidase
MLRNKVFGAYEDDDEFKLIYFAMMPLYTETYNPDAALRACRGMIFVAESHSTSPSSSYKFGRMLMAGVDDLYSEEEKYFDYTEKLGSITAKTLVIVGEKDWICPPGLFCSSLYCI